MIEIAEREADAHMAEVLTAYKPKEILADDDWEEEEEEEKEEQEASIQPVPVDEMSLDPVHLSHPISNPLPSPPPPTTVEASADEFYVKPLYHPLPTPSLVHPNIAVYIIYLLVCRVEIDPPMVWTLGEVHALMEIDALFQTLPVCSTCKQLYPVSTTPTTCCDLCDSPLFNTTPTVKQAMAGWTVREDPKPVLRFPYKSLEEQLIYHTANLLLVGIIPGLKEQNIEEIQLFLQILVDSLLRLYKGIIIITRWYPDRRLFLKHLSQMGLEHEQMPSIEKNSSSIKTALRKLNEQNLSRFMLLNGPMYFLANIVQLTGLVKNHFYAIWVKLNVFRKNKELRRLHAILAKMQLPTSLGQLPALIGEPAGGSLTVNQWLVLATVVALLALLQLWQDYMPENASLTLQQHKEKISRTIQYRQKKYTKADLKSKGTVSTKGKCKGDIKGKGKAQAPKQATHHSQHVRKPTQCAQALEEASSSDDSMPDAGVIETDDVYSSDNSSDDEADTSGGKRQWKGDKEGKNTDSQLLQQDVQHFMKLCATLKLLIKGRLTEDDIEQAGNLIHEYCKELVELYGSNIIKPNYYYATHTPGFIHDYSPLHGFWTFLFERLNKVLKSFNVNNHGGGELEMTFFREFHCTVHLSQTLRIIQVSPQKPSLQFKPPIQVKLGSVNWYIYSTSNNNTSEKNTLGSVWETRLNVFVRGIPAWATIPVTSIASSSS
ncbi:hypothetical protein C8Q75DRAFT_736488 [Abortiporus biennis]|nr:hypothetical protein C8Q75DRAFT_736488 [Abortiporus biennis]